MLVGIINLITGKRLIKFLLFLNGLIFFTGFVVVIATETVLRQNKDVRSLRMIWVGVSAVFFGLIGGLLCCRFYRFGLGIMGLLMGLIIGEIISHSADLENKWVLVSSWSLGIIFAIISIMFVDIMIVINTSFLGAQAFMLGIDYIVDKGYAYLIRILISMKPIEYTPTLWGMLASSTALNLLGMIIQYKAFEDTEYYKIDINK